VLYWNRFSRFVNSSIHKFCLTALERVSVLD
jgi:hypothetical protein